MENYRFCEELGKGKHSVVHKARKRKTVDYFAIKSLEKSVRSKLMNEVKIFNSLDHDNILKFYNWYESKNHFWAILEYAPGGSLLKLLEQDKKLSEDQVKRFSRDLISGLHYIHSKGIVYCDLKPSSVLLNEYDTLKYCDFGLAKKVVDLILTSQEVEEGSRKGTPSYMAPELYQDDGVHSFQSDLWSLGCLIYEMSSGKPPFESNSLQELVEQIMNKEVERIPNFSEEFHNFILGLLQKNPLKRIKWEEITTHPFLSWNHIQLKKFTQIEIPQQPHFELWCTKKYGYSSLSKLPTTVENMIGRKTEGVNVLRLSLNAQKNLQKEKQLLQQDAYCFKEADINNQGDYIIRNRDEIVDIGCGLKREIRINQEDQENCQDLRNVDFQKRNLENANQKCVPSVSPKYQIMPASNTNIILANTSNQQYALKATKSKDQSSFPVPQQLGISARSREQKQQMEGSSSNRAGVYTPTSPLSNGKNNLPKTPNSKNQCSTGRNNSGERFNGSATHTNQIQKVISKQSILSRTPSTPSQLSSYALPFCQGTNTSPYSSNKIQNANSNNLIAPSILNNMTNAQQINCVSTTISNGSNSNQSSGYPTSYRHHHSNSSTNNTAANNSSTISPHRNLQSTSVHSHNSSSSNNYHILQETKPFDPNYSSSSNSQNKKISSAVFESIEKLLIHNSDLQVKPIIGHKDIEKFEIKENCLFIKEILPFHYYEAVEVNQGIETQEIQQMLSCIFSVLSQRVGDITNVLGYFEGIIQNSKVANFLLNSIFLNLLLELLKSTNAIVRLRAASSVGFLLRFATSIENNITKLDLPSLLIEAICIEADLKVRRKLMAALGEYLFYAATQVDEEPNSTIWQISSSIISFLLQVICKEEDIDTRFYACKTVENITARSFVIGKWFCTIEAIQSIITLFEQVQNTDLKTSAAVSLMHISRLNNHMSESIIISLGGAQRIRDIIQSELESHKTQQAMITILNLQISMSQSSEITRYCLALDSGIIEALSNLTDSQHTILRGKSLLTLALYITNNFWSLANLCASKFFQSLDKLAKDNYKYVQQCFLHLKAAIENTFPLIVQSIRDEVNRLALGDKMPSNNFSTLPFFSSSARQAFSIALPGDLQLLNVFVEISNCQQLRSSFFDTRRLEECFGMVEIIHLFPPSSQTILMNLYEILLSQINLVLDRREFFIGLLLPRLLNLLQSQCATTNSQSIDWRFNSLKLVQDILCIFAGELPRWSQSSLQIIHELFMTKFINGILPPLLQNEDSSPIGIISLKILLALVESQPNIYVSALKQRGLLTLLLSQFNSNPSRSILRLVTLIAQASSLPEIIQLNILNKAYSLFCIFLKKEQDQCYEDLLDIFLYVTTRLSSQRPIMNVDLPCIAFNYSDQPLDSQFDILLSVYSSQFQLIGKSDINLSEKAALLIIHIIYLYSRHNPSALAKPENISQVVYLIQQYYSVGTILKRSLRILFWICSTLTLHPEMKSSIRSSVEQIFYQIKDSKLQQSIRDILTLLR